MADATMPAEWRACKRFPGYEVSNEGQVRGHYGLLTPQTHRGGYLYVTARRDGRTHKPYIHRLVAEAFCGTEPANHEVDHINGDRADNRASNLQWLTHAENMERKKAMGTWGRPTRLGPRMTYEKALAAHRMRAAGQSVKDIAAALGIAPATASWVVTGRSWKHARAAWLTENNLSGTDIAA